MCGCLIDMTGWDECVGRMYDSMSGCRGLVIGRAGWNGCWRNSCRDNVFLRHLVLFSLRAHMLGGGI